MNATSEKITGNTYPVKDQLKALGCRWDAVEKCWIAANHATAEKARAIVAKAPATAPRSSSSYRPYRCKQCGCSASRYNPIYRSGVCRNCYVDNKEEAEMGY